MKTYLSLLVMCALTFSQTDSFYIGFGIVNADLKAKSESFKLYENEFTQNPYFFIGYDVTSYERNSFRTAMNFGASYTTLENKYSNQKDTYNLIVLNLVPKIDFEITSAFALQLKLHADIKLFEFFANIDGSSDVRNKLSHLEGFNTFQFAYELGFQFSPEWMHQYSIEITYLTHLSNMFNDDTYEVKMSPTFQLSVYTEL